jgi:adenine phosphoribosyltransferase
VRLEEVLAAKFRWVHGHADIWRWFADASLFDATVDALAEPFASEGVTEVVGIESRGFLLAGAVARRLHTGVVPIRKRGAIFPGPKYSRTTPPDYRGRTTELLLRREVLTEADRVLIVDDWLETGSQMLTAAALVRDANAELVGVAVIVDQSSAAMVDRLPRLHSIIPAESLGDSSL